LLGHAAEAEARRRILITAIALEQYHCRHGTYPQKLEALVPALVEHLHADFMDGQPLRCHFTTYGHLVHYSIGLDCVDNGGEMLQPRGSGLEHQSRPELDSPVGSDLVWPRPPSAAEVRAQQQADAKQVELANAAAEQRQAEQDRQWEAQRQATIEKLLAEGEAWRVTANASSQASTAEPAFQGRPLSELLRNGPTAGTNHFTLDELLRPRQIAEAESDGTATFEVPVSYDA
jgi:hypothetical protein